MSWWISPPPTVALTVCLWHYNMSGQGFNVTDTLEEKSDCDQENVGDIDHTSTKEGNTNDYRIINNSDLRLEISRTNTLEAVSYTHLTLPTKA